MCAVRFFVNTNQHPHPSRRHWRLLTGVAAALVLFIANAGASARWATLEAIHRLENPRDLPTPGPCGELGAYQFREQTWRMHTSLPFARALDRRTSDVVAVKHYDWIKSRLEGAGIPATPYAIALAWNGGLDRAVRGRSCAATRDYAERVANIASTFGAAPGTGDPR